MTTISILIPVYFNEESLPVLFEKLTDIEQKLREKDIQVQLIFVDDGSGDGSFAELVKIKTLRPETKVIKLSRNFGAIRAEKTGYRYVTGDCFCTLSADLQDPPELIEQMIEHWMAGSKYVICVRDKRDDPFLSRMFSRIFYWLVRRVVSANFPRGGFDLALMDRALLPYLLTSGKNINPSIFSYSLGFKPEVIHYERQKREFGKSRWTFTKKMGYFVDSIVGFSIIPLHLISWLGIILALLSIFYGVYVFFSVLIIGREVPGFAALFTMTSFLFGLTLIMLGIIGQYLWRIFDQLIGMPESVVELEL